MGSRTRAVYPRELNKGFSPEFALGYSHRHTTDEGLRPKRPKRCVNNNKDEDNKNIVNVFKTNVGCVRVFGKQ